MSSPQLGWSSPKIAPSKSFCILGFCYPTRLEFSLDHILVVEYIPGRILIGNAALGLRDCIPGSVHKDSLASVPLGIVLDSLIEIIPGRILGPLQEEIFPKSVQVNTLALAHASCICSPAMSPDIVWL